MRFDLSCANKRWMMCASASAFKHLAMLISNTLIIRPTCQASQCGLILRTDRRSSAPQQPARIRYLQLILSPSLRQFRAPSSVVSTYVMLLNVPRAADLLGTPVPLALCHLNSQGNTTTTTTDYLSILFTIAVGPDIHTYFAIS